MLAIKNGNDDKYVKLRRSFLIVYLLASFVDWLQGPYLYLVYISYNYTKVDISFFYIIGFFSSAIFGIIIGNLADKFGRKKLCLIYFLSTIATCLSIIISNNNYTIHLIGRVFGGISSAILYSTFESWYIGQHISYNIDEYFIGSTFTKSTFYNGIIAIISGLVSSLLSSDEFNIGPIAPFIFSIPISIFTFLLCLIIWSENNNIPTVRIRKKLTIFHGLTYILFSRNKYLLINLLIIQTIFESTMYTFIFIWTPIVEPINPNYGLIFSGFMASIALGSYLHLMLEKIYKLSRETSLNISIILALISIGVITLGVYLQLKYDYLKFPTYLTLVAFFFFELSVGFYYPTISYIRGIIVPENYRACIVNWFRLPTNVFICAILFFIRLKMPDNFIIFSLCTLGLFVSAILSIKFTKDFTNYYQRNYLLKNNLQV